jgi:hypothetical protein
MVESGQLMFGSETLDCILKNRDRGVCHHFKICGVVCEWLKTENGGSDQICALFYFLSLCTVERSGRSKASSCMLDLSIKYDTGTSLTIQYSPCMV